MGAQDETKSFTSNKLKAFAAILKLAENGYQVRPGDGPGKLTIPTQLECKDKPQDVHHHFLAMAEGHSIKEIQAVWPDFFE
jgi:hypothetical protein